MRINIKLEDYHTELLINQIKEDGIYIDSEEDIILVVSENSRAIFFDGDLYTGLELKEWENTRFTKCDKNVTITIQS